jgi:hypothetical protein
VEDEEERERVLGLELLVGVLLVHGEELGAELDVGITGGEEDGVDNTSVDNSALYTQPEDILDIHNAPMRSKYLTQVSMFSSLDSSDRSSMCDENSGSPFSLK